MKQFYSVEPKHDFLTSSSMAEIVEYDINTLIRDEAELMIDDYNIESDDEYEVLIQKKAKEIKEELMRNGIWRNEFGHPIFLYC